LQDVLMSKYLSRAPPYQVSLHYVLIVRRSTLPVSPRYVLMSNEVLRCQVSLRYVLMSKELSGLSTVVTDYNYFVGSALMYMHVSYDRLKVGSVGGIEAPGSGCWKV
jgi:hypothetical protein